MIKTFIIDDEPLARERLRIFAAKWPELQLEREFENGLAALEPIANQSPDLLFLDIQMPEMTGFELLAALPQPIHPVVVFVTAYDKFALQAFEVHAIDYLLKPFDQERFDKAVARVIQHVQQNQAADLSQRLKSLLSDMQPEVKKVERIAVKAEGRIFFVKLDDIEWIEAADNYVNLHAGNERHMIRDTMSNLETSLPPNRFARVSRSSIVNLEKIKELQPLFHGDYSVLMRSGARLNMSRNYREKVLPLLKST